MYRPVLLIYFSLFIFFSFFCIFFLSQRRIFLLSPFLLIIIFLSCNTTPFLFIFSCQIFFNYFFFHCLLLYSYPHFPLIFPPSTTWSSFISWLLSLLFSFCNLRCFQYSDWAMGCRIRGSIPGGGNELYSNLQTGFGPQLISYSKGNGSSPVGDKTAMAWSWPLVPI